MSKVIAAGDVKPFASLIEFPEGDIDELYYRARVGMVAAHVLCCFSAFLMFLEFHASRTQFYLRTSTYSQNQFGKEKFCGIRTLLV